MENLTIPSRRTWPRITLVLSPEARDALHALAERNMRPPRQEALRLLLEGIAREPAAPMRAARR